MNTSDPLAAPARMALNRNNTAAIIITLRRPIASASRPAPNAPIADPTRIAPTLTPIPNFPRSNADSSPFCVPLITPESYPNMNPPIVAAATIPAMKRWFTAAAAASPLAVSVIILSPWPAVPV
jgi:hypothetical protein